MVLGAGQIRELYSTFPSGAQSHHTSGGYQIKSNETCQQWHRQIKDGGAICCQNLNYLLQPATESPIIDRAIARAIQIQCSRAE
jgi:hypothetical protein